MAKTNQTLVNEIVDHLKNGCGGGKNSEYYVGITKNIENRLFGDHNVTKEGHCYIFRNANSASNARIIEKYFLDGGMKGGDGGGDADSKYVYVYKISSSTKE